MKRRTLLTLAIVALLIPAAAPAAFGADSDAIQAEALREKQQLQERARRMTRELVTAVLDIQIRRLKENRLTEDPIYAEIQGMRANISKLVDDEMHRVVELLVEAQQAPREKRLPIFNSRFSVGCGSR